MHSAKMASTLILFATLAGCANWNSVFRTFDVSKGESPMVDIRQRSIIVAAKPRGEVKEIIDSKGHITSRQYQDNGMVVCAEPSPDAMASLAYELAAKGEAAGKASGELSAAMQDNAAFTGLRTQSIQLLRDFGYRLCESHMSGAISSAQYDLLMRRLQKNTVALLAIEQLTGTVKSPPITLTAQGSAETTKSLIEQRELREKIGDQINDGQKQKDALIKKKNDLESEKSAVEAQKTAKVKVDAKTDTASEDKKIKELDEQIKNSDDLAKIASDKLGRLQEDEQVIDKAIANTKGAIAGGKTNVTITTDGMPSQRSDEHIQKVAAVVSEIVNNIVLSDDIPQICVSALANHIEDSQKPFADWCLKTLNNQEDARQQYIDETLRDLQSARTKLSAAKQNEVADAQKKVEEALDKFEHARGGGGGGVFRNNYKYIYPKLPQ